MDQRRDAETVNRRSRRGAVAARDDEASSLLPVLATGLSLALLVNLFIALMPA